MRNNHTIFFVYAFIMFSLVSLQNVGRVFAQETSTTTQTVSQSLQDRLDFANGLYNRNMYEMAIVEYDALLEENANNAEAGNILFRLAESHFFLKKYDEVIPLYQSFTQKYTSHSQLETARLRLGETLYQLNDKDSALNQMQTLTESSDAKIKQVALYYTGKIFYEKENYEASKKYLTQIVSEESESPYKEIAHYYLGEVYLKSNDFNSAANQFNAIKNTDKKDLQQLALFNLGKTAYNQQQFEQSKEYFYQASLISENATLAEDSYLNYLNSLYALKDFSTLTQNFKQHPFQDIQKQTAVKLLATNAYLQLNQNEEAVQSAEEILQTSPLDPKQRETAELNKIEALIQIGDSERAKQALSAMSPNRTHFNEKWNFLAAQIYKDANNHTESISYFDKLINETPIDSQYRAQALIGKAYTLLESGNSDDARKTLYQFISEYPDHPLASKAAYDHILLDVKLEDWQGAIVRSKEFIEHFKDDPKAEDVHLRLASYYLQTDQYEDALKIYAEHLKNHSLTEEAKNEIFFYQAYANQLANKNSEAIQFYEKIAGAKIKNSLYASSLKNLAFLYVSDNQTDEAAQTYLKLIRQTPENDLSSDVYFWLVDHFLKEENPVAMLDLLNSLKQKDPTQIGDIHYFMSEAYLLQSNYAEAQKLSRQAIIDSTTYAAKAEFVLGKSLQALKSYDDALLAFEKSLKLAGNQHRIAMLSRIAIAQTHEQMNQFEKAAKAYLAVAILYDDDTVIPTTLMKAAENFEKAALTKEAMTAYEELIERFPNHELRKQAEQKLTQNSTPAN